MIIAKYEQVFFPNHKRPARCKLDETYKIPTEHASPQNTRPRRIPPNWGPEIYNQLKDMLAADLPLRRPSQSPWAADVVLVKNDGNKVCSGSQEIELRNQAG